MRLFVHVQAEAPSDVAAVERHWGSAAEAVSAQDKGLYLLMFDPFSATAPSSAMEAWVPGVVEALKQAWHAPEAVEVARWEYELGSGDDVLNAMLCEQGLVLTAREGVVAGERWPTSPTHESIRACVQQAVQTLSAARRAVARQ